MKEHKAKQSTSLINEQMFAIHDIKNGMSLSDMKRKASIMEDTRNHRVGAELRPHA
jgi:hypothetical protein